jgi:hypothetical protein
MFIRFFKLENISIYTRMGIPDLDLEADAGQTITKRHENLIWCVPSPPGRRGL